MAGKLQDHELSTIARAEEYDLWRFMKLLIEPELSLLEGQLRRSPKLCDEDITEDMRWKLADVARLKWLLEMPERARQELSEQG